MFKALVLTCAIFSMATAVEAQEIPLSDEYSVARGGRLYDKWFKINESGIKPQGANPLYPDNGKYKGKKGSDFRCKECHGWDYKGRDGIYSKGKHYTGTKGVLAAKEMSRSKLAQTLRDKNHRFTKEMLSARDANDLVNFIKKGMIEVDLYISKGSREPMGNLKRGEAYYQTICAGCHGIEGKDEDTAPPLGQLANKFPEEVLHKIRMGQPKAEMPSLHMLDTQIAVDILKYLRVLPQE